MSQDEFNQKVIEHLIALGERLESIERMLKPSYSVSKQDADAFQIQIVEEQTKEPEWRPMSAAPRERYATVRLRADYGEAQGSRVEDGFYVNGVRYHESFFSGWRPL